MSEASLFARLDVSGLKGFFRLRTSHLIATARWAVILTPVAAAIGSLCALFLWALDEATRARFAHPWLLFGLPLAGLAVGLVYHWKGKSAEGGNNLIVEQIHEPGGGVPLRMAPLILVSTVVTHLFGGSAGREGTAVQLGGSLASAFGKVFRLDAADTRILLMAGIAAGFGAVFGTPVAGAVFALEVLTIGQVRYEALIPCLVAGLIGDWTCHAWGIEHTAYAIHYHAAPGAFRLDPLLLAKVALAGVTFGLVGLLFSETQHRLSALFKRLVPYGPLRPLVGGVIVIALVFALGTREYLGLGVWSPNPGDATIPGFFSPDRVDHWSWLLKIGFTVITLSAGFKGGEVTPLFFIGAALGNALSWVLGAPTDLFAALGFVAVFAGAANTPLACTIMGVELFGGEHTAYIAVACFMAYLCSGHSGIYLSQRLGVAKTDRDLIPPDIALRQARELGGGEPLVRLAGRSPQILPLDPNASSLNTKASPMSFAHAVTTQEVGMVRIYMKPRENAREAKLKTFFNAKPLYRQLVEQAKAAGIMNAVAHHTHYGYSNHGRIQDEGAEISNPDLTMCVELIGAREQLEAFCREHGAMLQNKVIIYKHLEHWRLDAGAVEASEITPTVATKPVA